LTPGRFSESIIHGAYYEMRHAALAVLLRHQGGASTNHGRLVRSFRDFAVSRFGAEGDRLGADLLAAMTWRNEADYEPAVIDPDGKATELQEIARRFLAACEDLLR